MKLGMTTKTAGRDAATEKIRHMENVAQSSNLNIKTKPIASREINEHNDSQNFRIIRKFFNSEYSTE